MPQNLRQLTSLRFFAALWVVAYHYWPSLTPVRPEAIERGYLGVELFFVLSGFVLCHVYLDQAGERRLGYGGFLWARLARIYPLHLATLLAIGLMGAVALVIGDPPDHPVLVWSALPANLLLAQSWGLVSVSAWNHPSWSISAEWAAYLAFPLFAWAAWRLRARPVAAVLGVLAVIALVYPLFQAAMGFRLTEVTSGWGPARIAPCFALGCAVNLLWRAHPLADERLAIAAGVAVLAAIALGALAGAPDPLMVALFGALVFTLASMATAGSRRLAAAPLVWLGEVSFALYMVCIPWQLGFSHLAARLFGVGDLLPPALWGLQFAGVLVAAAVLHHLVERPARVWMRLHDPFRPRDAPAHIPASAAATL